MYTIILTRQTLRVVGVGSIQRIVGTQALQRQCLAHNSRVCGDHVLHLLQ